MEEVGGEAETRTMGLRDNLDLENVGESLEQVIDGRALLRKKMVEQA